MRPQVIAGMLCVCVLGLCCAAMAADDGVLLNRPDAGQVSAAASEDKDLEELMNLRRSEAKKMVKMTARMRVIGDTASTMGFQMGFRHQYAKLLAAAKTRSHEFEKAFDFRRLLIDGRVLPPVIRWSGPAINVESDDYATEVEAQYRIVAPAKIVSAPPSWEQYLEADMEVLKPAAEILPDSRDERSVWRESAKKGWAEGAAHAYDVFEMNLNKLVSDYRGILRFKMLAERGLVSVPVLARGDLGIRVGKDVLSMDQKSFRITVPAEFRALENQ